MAEVANCGTGQVGRKQRDFNMKLAVFLWLLVVAAAAPAAQKPGTPVPEEGYPAAVKKALDEALVARPKTARQLFHEDITRRKDRKLRRLKKARSEGGDEEKAAVEKEEKQENGKPRASLDREAGWKPMDRALAKRQLAKARRLFDPAADPSSDLSGDVSVEPKDSVSGDSSEDSVSGDAQEEDREAEDSLLSPLYAPPPGYQHYGGSYGPYIYILPIVLPPPSHGHPGPAHVVTETGHESHHYSAGTGHHQYRPLYAGAQGVPPIYIPKEYGLHRGHGVHGKHGAHTTVHHEDKTIIRDINPPIFKA